jgi:hypothetical protein
MAKSGKEDAKGQGKEGEKGTVKMDIEGEAKSKEVATKPIDPVTACLNGKL